MKLKAIYKAYGLLPQLEQELEEARRRGEKAELEFASILLESDFGKTLLDRIVSEAREAARREAEKILRSTLHTEL